jgi:hypothetical protein
LCRHTFKALNLDLGVEEPSADWILRARRLAANKVYLLCSILAHNLSRELQMQIDEPVRRTTGKRTVRWLFEEIDTLRRTIIARAERLTRPQDKLTLTLNANPPFQGTLLRFPQT